MATLIVCGIVPIGLLIVVAACSGPKENPFEVSDRVTTPTAAATTISSTPLPTVSIAIAGAMAEAAGKAHLASLFAESQGAVKFGERSNDKAIQFQNALAGYMLVYGYDWTVELVPINTDSYQNAFNDGEIDVLLDLDKEAAAKWYDTHMESGSLADVGSMYDLDANSRIIVHGGLKERAPEVVEFLGKAKPTDELTATLSASISSGRMGIKPTVAALKFLKEHEDLWTQWVEPAVADKIKAAIEAGKASLVNRKCIPDGGAGGGSPNCGT